MQYRKSSIIIIIVILLLAMAVPVLANPTSASEYRLSKYDVLNIVIVGFSENLMGTSAENFSSGDFAGTKVTGGLNDIMIGPDGYVNLPYAGSMKLAGLTIPEATGLLTARLGEYIKIPSMSVMVKQYGKRKVYVMGEVNKPGIYDLSSEYMNVFAALSSASGIAKKGRTKEIAIVRVVDNKVDVKKIDIDKFIKKQDITQNVPLQDGDMVYVPKSNKIDINEDIMPIVTLVGLYRNLTD